MSEAVSEKVPSVLQGNGPLVVCFAVKEEAKFFKAPPGTHIVITGMGYGNAEAGIEAVFEKVTPRVVLTCGFAGGLNPALKNDDVIFDADELLRVDEKWQAAGAKKVNFFCAKRVAITSEEKLRLWKATGLDAVEMESQTIRQFCRERQVPSATVRVISDSAGDDLPLDFNTLLTPAQKINYGKLTWALVRAPMKFAELISFQGRTIEAAKSLGAFLQKVLPI